MGAGPSSQTDQLLRAQTSEAHWPTVVGDEQVAKTAARPVLPQVCGGSGAPGSQASPQPLSRGHSVLSVLHTGVPWAKQFAKRILLPENKPRKRKGQLAWLTSQSPCLTQEEVQDGQGAGGRPLDLV